ncbi:hypothetical protein F5Y00DRAFT_259130 [Daldinia vernicosa]|uniref:uncharacterized protein n=1 Tax=Daldinia vernicosa TaxID=114800 RepID=UPI002007BD7B|nr:uncharacterized protein F5Y00DRAFT_259130 [Daldinia vernicosa]KAI0851641.1 hypothetical protein F5Y00DRAFT_259130 [Daldinia vernicosa]
MFHVRILAPITSLPAGLVSGEPSTSYRLQSSKDTLQSAYHITRHVEDASPPEVYSLMYNTEIIDPIPETRPFAGPIYTYTLIAPARSADSHPIRRPGPYYYDAFPDSQGIASSLRRSAGSSPRVRGSAEFMWSPNSTSSRTKGRQAPAGRCTWAQGRRVWFSIDIYPSGDLGVQVDPGLAG